VTARFDPRRRAFVRRSLAAGAAAGLAPTVGFAAPARLSRPAGDQPRNIVWVVSDGMSAAVPDLAESFSQQVQGRGTAWRRLAADPGTAFGGFEVASLDSPVPDSAAVSSAWGSGSLVANGAINTLPDGESRVPLASLLRDAGRRVGLVTTTRITHATPAGFAAAVASREQEDRIAEQYLGRVDLLLGGGRRHFGDRGGDGELLARYRDAGYAVLRRREDLDRIGRDRAIGLFHRSHLPFAIDRRSDPAIAAEVPSLAEMSRAALRGLAATEQPFLLQIEGGRVDHAAHLNDAASLLWDQLDLDEALAVALAFAAERGDTLVVATSDHGNANPGLNGMGSGYRRSGSAFARIAASTRSFEWLLPRLSGAVRSGEGPGVAELAAAALGVELEPREVEAIARAVRGETAEELNPQFRNVEGQLGRVLSAHWGIGWCGTSHTSDWMPIMATGPGAGRFAGLMPHREAFGRILESMGVAAAATAS
jgi:alkaline phosphatase